jgi:LysR family nod box-dependent transcriptional activator
MDLRRFDLALLPALDALQRERNVTRPATLLFVSQQALSSTLHRLRDYFEDELLVRVGRRFELTPLSQSRVTPVRDALLAAKAVLDARPTFDPVSVPATFNVAMSDYALIVPLPHLLHRLERDAPHLTLVIEAVKGDSLRQLATGDLDLCLASNDFRLFNMDYPDCTLRSDVLFEDDFVVVFAGTAIRSSEPLDSPTYRGLRHGVAVFEEGVMTIVERGGRGWRTFRRGRPRAKLLSPGVHASRDLDRRNGSASIGQEALPETRADRRRVPARPPAPSGNPYMARAA